MGIFDLATNRIGIDPGSESFRLIKNEKLAISEPNHSLLTNTETVNYSITDFLQFETLLKTALNKADVSTSFISKGLILYYCIPGSSNNIEIRAYRDAADMVGSRETFMIRQNYAAAINLNILYQKKDFILIDFSTSKLEISIFSNSIVVASGLLRLGTKKLLHLFVNYIFKNYQITLTEKEVITIFNSFKSNTPQQEIRIKSATIKFEEIKQVTDNYFNLANDEIITTLAQVRHLPNFDKIFNNGFYITGGGALTEYFIKNLLKDFKTNFHISTTPLTDNINGLLKVIKNKNEFKPYILT